MNTASTNRFTLEDYFALSRVMDVAASPCGKWAAVSVERLDRDGSKFVSDLWKVALDGSGQKHQLTRGKSRDRAPCFRHDGALGFLSNRIDSDAKPEDDAEERAQIWLLPADGGEAVRLSDEPLGVQAFRFAKNSPTVVWSTPVLPGVPHENQREAAAKRKKHGPSARHYTTMPVRDWDHWLGLATSHLIVQDEQGRRDLTPDARRELDHLSFDISADGKQVVATWETLGSDRVHEAALKLFELADGSERLLASEALCTFAQPLFSPDGTRLVCQAETRSAHTCPSIMLRLIDIASGQIAPLAPTWNAWPTPQAWHPDGQHLFVTADEQGTVPVFEIELDTGDITRLTERGSHGQVQVVTNGRDIPGVIGVWSTFARPPELFHLPLNRSFTYYPSATLSGFDPATVAFTVENLCAISSDQHPVQSWLLKPAQSSPAPLPTLVWIHGGPIHAWSDGWHWRWNPLLALAQGFAVALPNPRGSTGFGQAFIEGIWGNQWGAQCYDDLMAVTDLLATRSDLDSTRMAAMGGSFGGYMTNWIGTRTDRFQCLVTHASVYSMSAFTGVTDLPAFWMLEMDGNPYSDTDRFDRYSPSRGIANWKSPTLITHGDLDYRVPISEGLALFEALQYHGVPSELLIFPDENHWILKPNNSLTWYQTVFDFLQRHLAGSSPPR